MKERITKLVGPLLRAKEGHILLAERQVHRSQGIEGRKLARIGLKQTNMRDSFSDALWFAWCDAALSLLLHDGVPGAFPFHHREQENRVPVP